MDQHIIDELRNLVNICEFRTLALQKAAEHLKVPVAAQFLQDHAQESQIFADELLHLLLSMGVTSDVPEYDDICIPDINDRTYHGVISWCAKQEQTVCAYYSAVLDKVLPQHIRSIIQGHLEQINRANSMLFKSI